MEDLPEKARARSLGVQVMLARAEACFDALHEHLRSECEGALVELRDHAAFDEQDHREQGRLFAQRIEGHPFAMLLHGLRRGHLSREDLRRRYPRPAELITLVEEAGLVPDGE